MLSHLLWDRLDCTPHSPRFDGLPNGKKTGAVHRSTPSAIVFDHYGKPLTNGYEQYFRGGKRILAPEERPTGKDHDVVDLGNMALPPLGHKHLTSRRSVDNIQETHLL
jgi:hypothetical protein